MNAIASPAATVRPSFIDDVVRGRISLPSIPRVVQRLITGLRQPDVSVGALADELAQDPVLAARVLRLANSAYYCGQRSLASVPDAVAVIGTQALQTLVIACGVSSAFVEVPGVNLRQFWLEAAVAGAAAHALARDVGAGADSAHAAALLADTGHLILCQAHPDLAAAVFTRYRNLRGAALAEVEQEHFGVAHPAVGALWVDKLGFPHEVGRTIAAWLDDDAVAQSRATPAVATLAAVVRVAREAAATVSDGEPVDALRARLAAGPALPLALQAVVDAPFFAERCKRLAELPSIV